MAARNFPCRHFFMPAISLFCRIMLIIVLVLLIVIKLDKTIIFSVVRESSREITLNLERGTFEPI